MTIPNQKTGLEAFRTQCLAAQTVQSTIDTRPLFRSQPGLEFSDHVEADSGRLLFDVEAKRAHDAGSGRHHEDSDRIAGTLTPIPGKRSLQWLLEACNLDDPDAKNSLQLR